MTNNIGLLFELEADIMSDLTAKEQTHYHWREPEEVEAVAESLTALGYKVDKIGTLNNLLERWRFNQLPDFVWNLSVRTLSRNRTALAPAILEQLGIPYTGGDATVKSLTLNKDLLKPVLQWYGILTPPWYRYETGKDIQSLPPWSSSILKPSCEGYSLGLRKFDNQEGLAVLRQQVEEISQLFHVPVLCEEFIAGREITVGIVGNSSPLLFGAVETVNAVGESLNEEVLDLQAKRQGKFKKIGVDLADSKLRGLRDATLELMKFFAPLDYATFDFRIASDGRAYLLDINADATLHPQRSFAQIAGAAGLSYQQLIEVILKTCLARWEKG
ncbi:D-alanine--D-alanine ligase [Scytonema sp. UIC 10036]|uniref:D-alanine--D-alanine ligase n=1 Tax=Scytonema sp. UIC 10036 TaxID=2304196 RepID=UPI0012DABF5A|nr:D-alanine--D-alanine ligase [Scytonema sp. UIC 10036]MUG98459.1 D-alanine--D-alanine ligase [Scytonema sp. UIC 10036]